MRRLLATGIALMLLGAGPPAPAAAQDAPAQRADPELMGYLVNTPLTLLDWGMLRLERDLDRAVRRLGLERGAETPLTGTLYRYADRRIVAYVSFAASGPTRTASYCRDVFGLLRAELLGGAPGGADGAAWYLERIFSSDVRRDRGRPEQFGAKLLDAVELEVTLRPPPDQAFGKGPGKMACAGRLDQDMAVIVPAAKPEG